MFPILYVYVLFLNATQSLSDNELCSQDFQEYLCCDKFKNVVTWFSEQNCDRRLIYAYFPREIVHAVRSNLKLNIRKVQSLTITCRRISISMFFNVCSKQLILTIRDIITLQLRVEIMAKNFKISNDLKSAFAWLLKNCSYSLISFTFPFPFCRKNTQS